ncbi:MAG: hypothetical protein ACI841_002467 [Planctomycetota bacterium]|jgi:membrane protein implicated in regulation of membrane protease activity
MNHKILRLLASWCFGLFMICALTAAASGVMLIWGIGQFDIEKTGGQFFLTALLLTVLTGLAVSCARAMIGVLKHDEDE